MIYLDHAAATDVWPEIWQNIDVLKELKNPSSAHQIGQKSRNIIDQARYDFGQILNFPGHVIFTSGATESIFQLMVGRVLAVKGKRSQIALPRVMHSAMRNAAQWAVDYAGASIVWLDTTYDPVEGVRVDCPDYVYMPGVACVFLEYGNSEIGVLPNLTETIAKFKSHNIPVFLDMAGSINSVPVNFTDLGVDGVVLSAEKFGGLAGTGVTLVSPDIEIEPIQRGSQENGRRGGTENTVGIWAAQQALHQWHTHQPQFISRCHRFQAELREFCQTQNYAVTTPVKNFIPHIFHFQLPSNINASTWIKKADLTGLAIASGPACSSGAVGASETMKSLGFDESVSCQGVRISWGMSTTLDEIEAAIEIMKSL